MTEQSQTPQTTPPPLQMEAVSGKRMIFAMGSIGILAGILLVFTYVSTLPAIERNKAEALERAIFEVLPGAVQKMTFAETDGRLNLLADAVDSAVRYYAGYDESGQLIGVAVEAAGQGFQDTLRVLYGYSPDCACIVGFKVLESKETPGLGDKIETDPVFTANFEALDVQLDPDQAGILNPVALVKRGRKTEAWQIEGITGATISARAVTRILHDSTAATILLLEDNLQELKDGSPGDYAAKRD